MNTTSPSDAEAPTFGKGRFILLVLTSFSPLIYSAQYWLPTLFDLPSARSSFTAGGILIYAPCLALTVLGGRGLKLGELCAQCVRFSVVVTCYTIALNALTVLLFAGSRGIAGNALAELGLLLLDPLSLAALLFATKQFLVIDLHRNALFRGMVVAIVTGLTIKHNYQALPMRSDLRYSFASSVLWYVPIGIWISIELFLRYRQEALPKGSALSEILRESARQRTGLPTSRMGKLLPYILIGLPPVLFLSLLLYAAGEYTGTCYGFTDGSGPCSFSDYMFDQLFYSVLFTGPVLLIWLAYVGVRLQKKAAARTNEQ